MPLRPDPLKELLDLQERMNRLFDETLGRENLDEPAAIHGVWMPVADVLETADSYVIELELPGLAREQIEIQAHGDELVVRGERSGCLHGKPETFHRLERHHGPFARGFRFAEEVDPDHIRAEFTDGLLRLLVPKAGPRRTTRIRVERGQ